MRQYFQDLRENFNNGIKEFSEHPLKYIFSAAKDFVKDYWDLGAMVLAGFAFNDHGNEVFGDARFYVMLSSGLAGLAGAGEDRSRFLRNLYAGFASWYGFLGRGMDAPLSAELQEYGAATFMAAVSLYMDGERRREQTARSKNSQSQELTQPLENIVE